MLVATRLADAEVQAFDNDLRVMFAPAETKTDCHRPVQPDTVKGSILAGQVVGRGGRTALRIEVPGVSRGSVAVAVRRGAEKIVQVAIRNGIGTVTDDGDLHDLFPGGVPGRTDGSWSSVLWEKQNRTWIPFPVVVPLLEPASGRPDAAIVELLEEECGWWPPPITTMATRKLTATKVLRTKKNQKMRDRETWTEAEHQGELDRIGVAVAGAESEQLTDSGFTAKGGEAIH